MNCLLELRTLLLLVYHVTSHFNIELHVSSPHFAIKPVFFFVFLFNPFSKLYLPYIIIFAPFGGNDDDYEKLISSSVYVTG